MGWRKTERKSEPPSIINPHILAPPLSVYSLKGGKEGVEERRFGTTRDVDVGHFPSL